MHQRHTHTNKQKSSFQLPTNPTSTHSKGKLTLVAFILFPSLTASLTATWRFRISSFIATSAASTTTLWRMRLNKCHQHRIWFKTCIHIITKSVISHSKGITSFGAFKFFGGNEFFLLLLGFIRCVC